MQEACSELSDSYDASPPRDSRHDYRFLWCTARRTAEPRSNLLPMGPRQECPQFVGAGLQSMQPPSSILPLLPLQDHRNTLPPSNFHPMPGRPPHVHPIPIHLPPTQLRRDQIHYLPVRVIASRPGQIRFSTDPRRIPVGFRVVPSERAVCAFREVSFRPDCAREASGSPGPPRGGCG